MESCLVMPTVCSSYLIPVILDVDIEKGLDNLLQVLLTCFSPIPFKRIEDLNDFLTVTGYHCANGKLHRDAHC